MRAPARANQGRPRPRPCPCRAARGSPSSLPSGGRKPLRRRRQRRRRRRRRRCRRQSPRQRLARARSLASFARSPALAAFGVRCLALLTAAATIRPLAGAPVARGARWAGPAFRSRGTPSVPVSPSWRSLPRARRPAYVSAVLVTVSMRDFG